MCSIKLVTSLRRSLYAFDWFTRLIGSAKLRGDRFNSERGVYIPSTLGSVTPRVVPLAYNKGRCLYCMFVCVPCFVVFAVLCLGFFARRSSAVVFPGNSGGAADAMTYSPSEADVVRCDTREGPIASTRTKRPNCWRFPRETRSAGGTNVPLTP